MNEIEEGIVEPENADLEAEEVETPEDGEEIEPGDPEGEDSGSESGDEEDVDLGQRAKKRIDKLLQRSKSAEAENERLKKELETARKLGGDDGKVFVSAAQKAGILPGLMSKDEAEAFEDLETIPGVIKSYRKWLRNHDKGDELEMGGRTLSFGDVEERIDELQETMEALKSKYGERRNRLQAEVREIYELGVAAKKAGWKPGEKRTERKKVSQTRPAEGITRKPENRSHADEMDVTDGDSLEKFMMARRRKAR